MRTFYWHEKKNLDLSRFFLIIGVTSWLENLNLRGGFKKTIMDYIAEKYRRADRGCSAGGCPRHATASP